jgi:hypothetical protein
MSAVHSAAIWDKRLRDGGSEDRDHQGADRNRREGGTVGGSGAGAVQPGQQAIEVMIRQYCDNSGIRISDVVANQDK